jgi:O-antigen/teichoic acid export membrane protein
VPPEVLASPDTGRDTEQSSHKQKAGKFIRDVFFSNLPLPFFKLRTYLWLVVLSRAFGPSGYGVWSLFYVTLGLAMVVASMFLGNSMMRFLSGERTTEETNQALSSVLAVVSTAAATLGLLFIIFSKPLADLIFRQSGYRNLLFLLAGILFFDLLYEEMRGLLRARRLNRTWAFFTLTRIAPETLATLAIAWRLRSVSATLGTYLAGGALAAGCGMLYLARYQNVRLVKPSCAVLSRYIPYGLGLVPGGLASTLSFSADRYLVAHYLDLKQVGIYSFCFAISALGFFFVAPINDVLLPEMSALYDAGDWDNFHRRFSGIQKFVFGLSVGATALLVAFPQHVLQILTTREFSSGSDTLAILALQGVFMSLVMLYMVMLSVRLRVWSTSLIWAGIGTVVILIEIILLPRVGLLGAGLAQLISSIAGAALVIGLNWHLFRRTFQLPWVFQTGMAFTAVYATAFFWPATFAGFFPSVARLAVGTVTFVLGLAVTGYLGLSDLKILKESLFLTKPQPGKLQLVIRSFGER